MRPLTNTAKVLEDPLKRNTKPLRMLFVTGQEMHCYFFSWNHSKGTVG